MNFRRLRAVARKEFIHVFRDWRSLVLAVAIPALLILIFGYALDMDLDNVPTVVWDQSRTPESRELIALFSGSPYFSITGYSDGYGEMQHRLENGEALLALVVPADFVQRLRQGRAQAQVIADGSDANTARLALGYASALGALYNGRVAASLARISGRGAAAAPIVLEPRAWYNPDLRSVNTTVPGIIVIVMIVIAAMLTSVTVAREWELGTMEQLIGTPIRVPELVLGKVLPYYVIGMADVAIAVVLGQWLFQVPLRGQPALLFFTASIFLTGALFFGLMLSIRLKAQVLANQAAIMASYLPTLLLSGFAFAIENMPVPVQMLTYLIPGRYFIEILRDIYLKGVGLEIIWFNTLLLAIYAALMVVLAHKSMKLKLE
ncbi:MAG: Inner membrane transport permease YbhS [Candidatus Hydrogenedentes bacterium ADurb.Bin101]|nr:MAG: Inner membrane transport permease YbhS [Candidatus Hydrogenedentes bacterium ADurb.Bin101]HOC67675.1 ABC transporter permease [Candidatus Hydrogenedentota bacterium]